MDTKRSDQNDLTQPSYSYSQNFRTQKNLCSDEDISSLEPQSHHVHMKKAQSSPKNFYGAGPRGYRRSDVLIKEDICDGLYQDPQVDASDISVDVKDGVVTLEGTVENRPIKHRIEDLVANCFGVEFIHNNIRVQ